MEEFKKRLADRFEGHELVDLLCLDVEDVIEVFWEQILEAKDDLEDFMHHGR